LDDDHRPCLEDPSVPELAKGDRVARLEPSSHGGKRTVRSRERSVERPVTTTIDRAPEERLEEPGRHTDRERAWARGLVIAIGVVFLAIHLLLIPRDWPNGWDESVYLSQVTPGMDGLPFHAWHARGITLIVAPVTSLGGSVADVRLFLMVLAAITITATFWLWVPLVGMAAAVAAFVFSFSWQGQVLASEVKPNYWGALLGLAATALIARRLEGGRTRYLLLASVLLAATALVRPTEATVLAGAIGVYILLWRRKSWRDIVPLGVGLSVGWLPWIIEMSVRFGGLTGALREAGKGQHFVVVPIAENVLRHLAYTDDKSLPSTIPGTIWWAVLVVVAAVAIARGVTMADRGAALLCALAALALAVEYLIFVPALAPRFLLPAYAIASVPFGIGLVSLLRGNVASRVIGAVVLMLLVPWTIWQGAVTAQRAPTVNKGSTLPLRVGSTIRRLAEGRPCFVLAQRAYPQIAFTARCSGEKGESHVPSDERLKALARSGRVIFVARIVEAPKKSLLSSLEPLRFPKRRGAWYVYQLPASSG
jgi:hypothetical protein